MREREYPRLHADFLCSPTKPDVRVRDQTLSCALAHLCALVLDINSFHTWIKRQTLSANQIFLRLTR